MTELKQVILVRKDLKLPKGKMSAQCAHASSKALLKSDSSVVSEWDDSGMKKIILWVKDEKELVKLFQKAKDSDLVASLITDAGKTTIAPGTKTCVGIGPDDEEKIDLVTGDLKLVS